MLFSGELKRVWTVTILLWALAGIALAQVEWPQQTKLIAADASSNDYFGFSVSISGDYAILGASRGENGGTNAGAAYIFERNGTSWTQQAKLIASDGSTGDCFGCSVSISGDYAIVGANNEDENGTNAGAAYIFRRDGTSWIQQAKLTASDGSSNDSFGVSVSISGDYAIVGAFADGNLRGSAYIFRRDGTAWTEQAKLIASDGSSNDFFGYAVSISDEYVIVGAYGDSSLRGSAYIFRRDATAWTERAKLVAFDASANDSFGYSVSISGDHAIVGAYGDNKLSGSAYIFRRDGTGWTARAKLVASDGSTNDFFGYSVSISGDYAIVGAYGNDSVSGSAYIFKRGPTNWSQQMKLTASDPSSNDYFGYSVANGGFYVIAGAYGDMSFAGSAYTFRELGTLTLNTPNGGQELFSGTTYEISWQPGGPAENVLIEYSANNGTTWTTVDTVANTGSYLWDVPWLNSKQCLVRISDAGYPNVNDISNAVFTIRTGTLAVQTPAGGEELCAGINCDITWETDGTVLDALIEYSTDNGGSWKTIDVVANTGSYQWEVPQENSPQCRVRISDATYPTVSDVSSTFAIYVCVLTLQDPNGGEELIAGTVFNIAWQSEGPIQNVLLEYSINNGIDWIGIDAAPNNGSYLWDVPQHNSQECLVYISDVRYPTVNNDVSDETFTIYICTLSAEFTDDCWVDFSDYALLADWWQVSDCCEPDWCGGADLDGFDGVDWADLDIFSQQWLHCGNPFDPNCLP